MGGYFRGALGDGRVVGYVEGELVHANGRVYLFDGSFDLVELGGSAGAEDDGCNGGVRELEGGCAADTTACAGDEDDFSGLLERVGLCGGYCGIDVVSDVVRAWEEEAGVVWWFGHVLGTRLRCMQAQSVC